VCVGVVAALAREVAATQTQTRQANGGALCDAGDRARLACGRTRRRACVNSLGVGRDGRVVQDQNTRCGRPASTLPSAAACAISQAPSAAPGGAGVSRNGKAGLHPGGWQELPGKNYGAAH
jgi:hypothetical protein